MTLLSEVAVGTDVNDVAQSATVAFATSAGAVALAESELPLAARSNSGSNTGGPLGLVAAPASDCAIGRPRSGGGDDLTAEITATCFAGISSGKVCNGSMEMFSVA